MIAWSQQWSASIADALGATPVPPTMFEDAYWLRTADTDSGGATVTFAPLGAPGTIMMMEDLIACGAKTIVGVGAAGLLSTVTLQLEDKFNLHAREVMLPLDEVIAQQDEFAESNEHFEYFCHHI